MDFKDLAAIQLDILHNLEHNAPLIGLRNPMIGRGADDFAWDYPEDYFWTDSFYTGELWLSYMLTGRQEYANLARMRYPHFAEIMDKPLWQSHDLGFLFSLSAVADYKLTGNKEARALALRAAEALRSRYNWNGRYLVAWTAGYEGPDHARKIQGKIIIDCMQNLPLLMWAYKETGIETFKEVAVNQAYTSLKYLVREDYSTYHTFDFDTSTNEPLRGCTVQGWADESCWSRGQSWAVHGFAQMYLLTGIEDFLNASMHLSDYVMEHITPDCVPVFDYLIPEDVHPYKDSSAGAVTASGMLMLAEALRKAGRAAESLKYHDFGLKMIKGLRESCDVSAVEGSQGLLAHGASYVRLALEKGDMRLADAMLPYGDYYYFEAVMRALGHNKFFW